MKPIQNPAHELSKASAWKAFHSGEKRHIFITGSRHSGKTTLLKKLFDSPFVGLTTYAELQEAVFMTENRTQEAFRIGVFDPTLSGNEKKMRPIQESISTLGVSALGHLAEEKSDWVTIDEIGYLECDNEDYKTALLSLLEKKHVAAVIRKEDIPFLKDLLHRDDAFIIDTDNPFGSCGCVIMASGSGKRFGGNKLMADFNGKPLINSILKCTEGIFTERVVVTRHQEIFDYCKKHNVRVVLHKLPNRNDTVRLGLDAIGNVEKVMFCLGDQPLLRRETVIALLLSSNNNSFIWRTEYPGTHGSPILFPYWTYSELKSLPEGKGGSFIAKKYPERVKTVSVSDPNELKDVDFPTDIKALER